MNDLLSKSFEFTRGSKPDDGQVIEMTTNADNLDKFFREVESIKTELKEIETIHHNLQSSHEQSKTLHNAKSVKDLRSQMDSTVSLALKKAKLVKSRLESLSRDNATCRALPGSGPGSSSDRTRTSVLNSQIKRFKDSMDSFNDLRQKISSEYKETVERRYFTVTGEKGDDRTIEALISSGESEMLVQRAIEEQGRGRVMDTIAEIQERREAVREIERGLLELHQVFMDLSVLVEAQGEQLDDIESQVARANSFVRGGTSQLQTARKHQKNSRKCTLIAIILLLIIILVIVLPIVLRK